MSVAPRVWFIPGVSPIKVSTVHRAVPVDPATGLRSCRPGARGVREEVCEFWPPPLISKPSCAARI